MTDELNEIEEYLKNVKFKKKAIGGVDEADVFAKIQKLSALYQEAFDRQALIYESLLEDRDSQLQKLRGLSDE